MFSDEPTRQFAVCKRPKAVHGNTCKLWNRGVREIAGWPSSGLGVPDYRRLVALPIDTFPVTLREENVQ